MPFSKTSADRLATCDPYIQRVLNRAIEISEVDFGVAQGERTVAEQQQYFDEGKSRVNPKAYTAEELPLKGYHITNEIYTKSGAVDVYAYYQGGAKWDEKHLTYIAGVIMAVDGMMENKLKWGGNWDMDGEILIDQGFDDLPHFQMITRNKG